jgi:membrane-bound lytic murein transglycosylase F
MHFDLSQIQKRGKLIAITAYSQTSYIIYRGQPMGYEYELLQRLTEHLGLDLEIVVAENFDQLVDLLLQGKGDLIAYNLTITNERKRRVAFTDPHTITRQVLVQRKPENWRELKRHEIDAAMIRNPIDLEGKTVHVRRGSSYFERLTHLEDEIGGKIKIVTVPGNVATEELIRRVADGEIDYTVADENVAAINKTFYPDLDIGTRISLPQRVGWAVRKSSPALLKAVNNWLGEMKQSSEYNVIYNKYFKNRQGFRRRMSSEFTSYSGGQLSPWDEMIKSHAAQLGWDWRLLAAMVYQESEFDSTALSWAGAAGLMQMMPAIAAKFGVVDPTNPEQSLAAGTAYLYYLQGLYPEIVDLSERQKFVLASYNAGENHIADARRLTAKFGGDQNSWGDVAKYLLLKSDPVFYNDPAVRYGYCRGEEPLNYVTEILRRYSHYEQLIPAE